MNSENERNKPDCPLIGQDGNIFNLIFECADCALRCHTEQLLTEENTEELSEESSLALKM